MKPEFEMAAEASQVYLHARSAHGRGELHEAAVGYHSASKLWAEAARILEGVSVTEAIRQRINRFVALSQGGNIPAAQNEAREIEQGLVRARLKPAVLASLRAEWERIHQSMEPRQREWLRDWQGMKREAGSKAGLERLPRSTVARLLERYPALPWVHYLAYLGAIRENRFGDARKHLDDAIEFDPDTPQYHALRLNLVAEAEPDSERALSQLNQVYDRFAPRSAMIAFMYVLSLLSMLKRLMARESEILERAAVAADMAAGAERSDLSTVDWAWAQLLRRWCLWRLGRPGVGPPIGTHVFQRGAQVVTIVVSPAVVRRPRDPGPLLQQARRDLEPIGRRG